MTANLLTLKSSKTEFLLIGLKHQLARISSCSLDTAHSARNLGFIFDEYISFSDQISALSKSCYLHIRQLRCIIIIIIIIITRLVMHVKSFTKWRIASAGGHESAKVSSVVKFSLYQTLESCKTGEVGDYIWW